MKKLLSLVFLTFLIPLLTFGSYPTSTGLNDYANVIPEYYINSMENKMSIEDRKWRIHTGYGLEEFLPDMTARNIGSSFPSYLIEGNYGEGLNYGVDAIIEELGTDSWELRQKYLSEQKQAKAERSAKIASWFKNFFLGLLILGFLVLLIYIRHRYKEKSKAIVEKFNFTKNNIHNLSKSILLEKQGLTNKKIINHVHLLESLEKLSYNKEVDKLEPIKFFNREKNLNIITEEYNSYRESYDEWSEISSINNNIQRYYQKIGDNKRMLLNRGSSFLNQKEFLESLKRIEENSSIEQKVVGRKVMTESLPFTKANLKVTLGYLSGALERYDDTLSMNKEIIKKFKDIDRREKIVNSFCGLNKSYLFDMLTNIRNGYTNKSIMRHDLKDSLDYLKMKINDFDRVNDINTGIIQLKSSSIELNKELLGKYRNLLRGYNRLKKTHPVIINNHLPKFPIDKKYYKEKYFDNIKRLIDLSYAAIIKKEFKHADMLRKNCGDTKSKFGKYLNQLSNLEDKISRSKTTIQEYAFELNGLTSTSLYNKVWKKVAGNKDVSKSTMKKWNNLQKDLADYKRETSKLQDLILVATVTKNLFDSLTNIKRSAEKDIRYAENERERKRREEERRRRRSTTETTTSTTV